MKERITLLIKAKNLTAAQFADEIGVQKSSISHIISGRNNASLDFVQKILLRYPEVNMNWILFGKGSIFKEAENTSTTFDNKPLQEHLSRELPPVDLFSVLAVDKGTDFSRENALTEKPFEETQAKRGNTALPPNDNDMDPVENIPRQTETPKRVELTTPVSQFPGQRAIIKIVEFYSDNTYLEYFPAKP